MKKNFMEKLKKGVDKLSPSCYNKDTKKGSDTMMKKIIIGSRLQDTWGNHWFVVSKDKTGYFLHPWLRIGRDAHFTFEELKNWKVVSR